MVEKFKLKNTIKYPTSLIINGGNNLGIQITESLLEQGGYVILIDNYPQNVVDKIIGKFGENALISLLDYASIPYLQEDIRRLDYVFYLGHDSVDFYASVSTQTFLKYSNYLDSILNLAVKFDAKFMLTTSIKAHQLHMANKDLELNFGVGATQPHTVYTDMEVQRYAESLTLEYVQKANLNGRITRVGEIIGDGIDLTLPTIFNQLTVSAVTGQDLEMTDEGLDGDWYVSLQDAAYGVIRAQFSKDTLGQIFSISYPETVTHLALAYKIQELEPQAAEIVFKNTGGGLPSLKLYKPAPSLMQIGWKPRIDFNEAIKESLIAAKLFVISHRQNPEIQIGKSTLADKIKNILSGARLSNTSRIEEEITSGPVSRLIAERKQQAEERQTSINQAEKVLRNRQNQRNLTWHKRWQNWWWNLFLSIQARFEFLKQTTPTQFFGYSILLILSIIFYIYVVVPVVGLGKNIYLINESLSQLEAGFNQGNFNQLNSATQVVKDNLRQAASTLDSYRPVFNVLGISEPANQTMELLNNYANIADGTAQVTYGIAPLSEYLQRYVHNVSYRASSESYLAAGTSPDYSSIISELKYRNAYVVSGLEAIATNKSKLTTAQFDQLPEAITASARDFNVRWLPRLAQIEDLGTQALYLPNVLATNQEQSYLFVLLDNSRPRPLGGALAAYTYVNVISGGITDMRLQSVDNLTVGGIDLPDYAYSQLSLHSFNPITQNNIDLSDLASYGNVNEFGEGAKQVWSAALGREIDDVIVLDLNALEQWLQVSGAVEVEGTNVDASNLLTVLNLLQPQNATASRRHDLLAQIWARVWIKSLESWQQSLPNLQAKLGQLADDKHILLANNNTQLSPVINEFDLDAQQSFKADVFSKVEFKTDTDVVAASRYPAYNQSTKITVNSDLTIDIEARIRFAGLTNIDELTMCIPLTAKNVDIDGIENLRVNVRRQNLQCIISDIIGETEIIYRWEMASIESLTESEYNLSIAQSNFPGAEVISDIEITLAPGLLFERVQPLATVNGNSVVFTETVRGDQLIEVIFNKSI